ncbi:MAG: hypothetical protein FJ148_17615 [Deltaproteobacteria bacterium]|nr:hypothetical protein [Deltaproteobacteria bacterium]
MIGAAVAGTILVLPYTGRALLQLLFPVLPPLDAPFFLLPIAFGAWNVLWARRGAQPDAPRWGALLAVLVAAGANTLLALRGAWGASLLLLFLWVPTVYALVWTFVVAPLNRALDVEP